MPVALVRDGKIHIAKITTGRNYGIEIEVLSGHVAGDQLGVSPGDDIAEGVVARVAAPAAKPAA